MRHEHRVPEIPANTGNNRCFSVESKSKIMFSCVMQMHY